MSKQPVPGPESTADREVVHSGLIFELRPGGQWRFVLHGPDGTNYPNENVFREVSRLANEVLSVR